MSDYSKGNLIVYKGSLGEHKGVVHEVRNLFDEKGAQLTAYVVDLDGVGGVLTSGDALSPLTTTTPASIEVPRVAYADTTVPPPAEPDQPMGSSVPTETATIDGVPSDG